MTTTPEREPVDSAYLLDEPEVRERALAAGELTDGEQFRLTRISQQVARLSHDSPSLEALVDRYGEFLKHQRAQQERKRPRVGADAPRLSVRDQTAVDLGIFLRDLAHRHEADLAA